MVNVLSPADNQAVTQAINKAEGRTSAELMTVIAKASDHYQSFLLLYGLMLGSLIDLTLWYHYGVTYFPLLLLIQCTAITVMFIRPLAHLCYHLIPLHIRRHHAAHRAFSEYLHLTRHVATAKPIVLFYVSLAERYVHILPNKIVRDAIPDARWEAVVQNFTRKLPKDGLKNASLMAIDQMADMLSTVFPIS